MEELQATHRKQQRDLQSQITQRKKQASKKTRKAVNDECERLEADLKERQAREIAELNGEPAGEDADAIAQELNNLTLQVDVEAGRVNETSSEVHVDAPQTANGPSQQGKKRNRQKDRLARRAAEQEEITRQAEEEAENLPDLKDQERQRMLDAMKSHGLVEKEVRADGHCLYSAVADQLDQIGMPIGVASADRTTLVYKVVRSKAADYISSHQDDFVPFLEEPLEDYLHKVRDTGEWGGQLELTALAKTYNVDINVLQDFGRVEKIEGGGSDQKEIWLGYYKHGFGLGEHYNSLRKAG